MPHHACMALDPVVFPLLRDVPALIRRIVETAPGAARSERDDGWSAADIIAHLADVQIWAFADRIARMLVQREPYFEDQDELEHLEESGLRDASLEDALGAYEMRRRWTLPMLEAADPLSLDRTARHDVLGQITIEQIGHVWAVHDLLHLNQVLRLLQRPFWAGMGPARGFYADAADAGEASTPETGAAHIVATLAEAPALVRDLVALIPGDRLTAPADAGWSPRDVVAHWLETERVGFAGRIARLLTEDDPVLPARDPAADLDASGYRGQPLRELLDAWTGLRADNVAHLSELSPAQLARAGRHDRVGRIGVSHLAHEWAYHDLEHVQQLTTMLAGQLLANIGPFARFYPHGVGGATAT